MGKLPVLRAREVCAILERLGFRFVRQKCLYDQGTS
jgi:predicted RNA binding protein YcfA (HicA-like mRNA interferase family)